MVLVLLLGFIFFSQSYVLYSYPLWFVSPCLDFKLSLVCSGLFFGTGVYLRVMPTELPVSCFMEPYLLHEGVYIRREVCRMLYEDRPAFWSFFDRHAVLFPKYDHGDTGLYIGRREVFLNESVDLVATHSLLDYRSLFTPFDHLDWLVFFSFLLLIFLVFYFFLFLMIMLVLVYFVQVFVFLVGVFGSFSFFYFFRAHLFLPAFVFFIALKSFSFFCSILRIYSFFIGVFLGF